MKRVFHSLEKILSLYEGTICLHEDTYRGGVLWTICRQCGRQWADDEGGFKPHVDRPEVVEAREILDKWYKVKDKTPGETTVHDMTREKSDKRLFRFERKGDRWEKRQIDFMLRICDKVPDLAPVDIAWKDGAEEKVFIARTNEELASFFKGLQASGVAS